MPVTHIHSRWDSGNLIFHEYNNLADTGNVLTIDPEVVTVGHASNDVNFSWLGTTTGTFDLDAAAHTLVTTGLDWTITGDIALTGNLTVNIGDVQIGDDDFLMFGDEVGGDVHIEWDTSGTNQLKIIPYADNTLIAIGNGTLSCDLQIFGGTANYYIDFDADEETGGTWNFGQDQYGIDVKFFGATTGNYLQWDVSTDDLIQYGTAVQFILNSTVNSTTTGSGSIHTLGGLGVTLNSFFGGLVTANGDTGFRYNGTLVPDANRLDYGLGIGLRGTELTVNLANAASQNLDPIQMNINLTCSGGAPTSTSTVNGIYQLITHDTTAMPNLRLKGSDWTIYAAQNFQDAYVYQGELDIVGNVTIGGEAFAGSFYLNAGTGTYTVNDRLAALFAIVSGTATVTGDYCVANFMASANADVDSVLRLYSLGTATPTDMFHIENDGTVTNMVRLDNDGTAGVGILYEGTYTTGINFGGTFTDGIIFGGTVNDEVIQIGGTYDHGIRFTEDMVAGDVTNSFINIGDYTTAIAVVPAGANMFGVVHNVTMTANVAYWYQAAYTKITTSGTTTDTSIAGHALRMEVGSDLGAVYGIQSHVTISGARTCTGEVTAGSFYLNVGAGASSASSRINALQALVTGAGTITGSYYVADFGAFTNAALDSIVNIQNDSGSSGTSAIKIDLDGATTYAIDFQGTVPDGWTSGDLTGSDEYGAFDEYALIPVRIAGVTATLYLMAAQTWKAVTV